MCVCVLQVAFVTDSDANGEGPGDSTTVAKFDSRKDGTYISIPDGAALKDLNDWTFSAW